MMSDLSSASETPDDFISAGSATSSRNSHSDEARIASSKPVALFAPSKVFTPCRRMAAATRTLDISWARASGVKQWPNRPASLASGARVPLDLDTSLGADASERNFNSGGFAATCSVVALAPAALDRLGASGAHRSANLIVVYSACRSRH